MRLHIISLDNPYPPDYGGAIELWGKLAPLQKAGAKIFLHAFCKPERSNISSELQSVCDSVFLYPRKTGFLSWFSLTPYAVQSRYNRQILERIAQHPAPVLMDGIHSSALCFEIRKRFPALPIIIRTHNRETTYYEELARSSNGWFKKCFFEGEARKFSWYEPLVLKEADFVFSISLEELHWLQSIQPSSSWMPAFSPFFPANSISLPETFHRIAFIANFSITENQKAAEWLMEKIIPDFPHLHWTFAGKNPIWKTRQNIEIISNPKNIQPVLQSQDLLLVVSFQCSGIKLKLLEAIASGKPFLTTADAWTGSGMNFPEVCFQDKISFEQKLTQLKSGELLPVYKKIQQQYEQLYNPQRNASELLVRIAQIKRPVI